MRSFQTAIFSAPLEVIGRHEGWLIIVIVCACGSNGWYSDARPLASNSVSFCDSETNNDMLTIDGPIVAASRRRIFLTRMRSLNGSFSFNEMGCNGIFLFKSESCALCEKEISVRIPPIPLRKCGGVENGQRNARVGVPRP
jgi:hypothetical protein